jgi:cold-inducible RNA-binding protein
MGLSPTDPPTIDVPSGKAADFSPVEVAEMPTSALCYSRSSGGRRGRLRGARATNPRDPCQFVSAPRIGGATRGVTTRMSKKLFVGGLSWGTTDDGLHQAFSRFGEIVEAKVITDRETGRSRGFGFVTFAADEGANSAISEMDGTELDGRTIKVNEAEDKGPRGGGGGGGGGGRGGRGGRGGGRGDRW